MPNELRIGKPITFRCALPGEVLEVSGREVINPWGLALGVSLSTDERTVTVTELTTGRYTVKVYRRPNDPKWVGVLERLDRAMASVDLERLRRHIANAPKLPQEVPDHAE